MSSIERVILVCLDGETPSDLGLPSLSHLTESMQLLESAVTPFLCDNASIVRITDVAGFQETPNPKCNGITLVYIVGHGWRGDGGIYATSIRSGSTSTVISGNELLRLVGNCISSSSQLLLLIDTCASECVGDYLHLLSTPDYTAIFASSAGERAWNLRADRGTQFAFAVSETLTSTEFHEQARDAVDLFQHVKDIIENDVSAPYQGVSRRVSGRPIILESSSAVSRINRRKRTRL